MHILVADDDGDFRRALAGVLADRGHHVSETGDAADALLRLCDGSYDLVVADVRMPPIGGFTLLRRARAAAPDTPVALMTSFPSIEDVVCAMQSGAVDYLVKPFDEAAILELLRVIARHRTVTGRHRSGTFPARKRVEIA